MLSFKLFFYPSYFPLCYLFFSKYVCMLFLYIFPSFVLQINTLFLYGFCLKLHFSLHFL